MKRLQTKARLGFFLLCSYLSIVTFTPVVAADLPADIAKWNDTITVDGPLIKGPGPSACRLWLPEGVKRVRAIFLFTTYGCWNDFAAGPLIRDLGRDLQCGVVLTEFYQHEATFTAPLLAALQTLAERSGHPEVAHAPLFVFSHSNSTPGMANFAARVPTRIAGWVAMKSASGGQFSVPGIYRIPGMVVSGEADGYFQNQLETVRKLRRGQGALMHMLVEAGGGHWPEKGLSGPTYQIMMAFLKNVFYLRVPADGDATLAPIKLNDVVEADGWLGQNVFGRRIAVRDEKGGALMEWEQPTDVKRLLEIAPFADFPGDPGDASWLPSADYARKWQEYCHTVAVKDWARMPPGTVEAWQAKRRLPTIEGLESTLLASQVKRLSTDSDSTAVLKELRRLAAASAQPDTAKEATRLLGVLDRLGVERLAQAKRLEATHPPSALAAYQSVVRRFAGFAVAEAARERVNAKDLKREVAAWAALDRLIQLDGTLVTPNWLGKRAKPQTDAERFAGDNKKILNEIDSAGNGLLREFADTVAAKEARAMLTRLGIPVPTGKTGNAAP